MNCVTACKECNSHKSDKTLKEARMELLYVPYAPNHYENMILQNRTIRHDQMEYLLAGVPKHSRILLN
jgi:5-methylcytosine-specific restriction endonuclease McrA